MRLRCALILLITGVATLLMGESLSDRAPRLSGAINEAALQRFKSHSTPLISADGTVAVRSLCPERVMYRYPVLRFADEVRRNFAEEVFPIGSRDYPLSIELGAETEPLTTLEKRILRLSDNFSQLIIRIPNPDTVSLDTLRVAIVEAQLREEIRAVKGSYAALKLPPWFIEALVDASRSSLWRAEAYETAHKVFEADTLPTLEQFFVQSTAPSKEVAACFAMWVLELNAKDPKALLTADWTQMAIVGFESDMGWTRWFEGQASKVFMPGLLTRSQFARWKNALRAPATPEMAVAITETLSRDAMGKPQIFRDLTALYLKAYGAYAMGDTAAYDELRAEADAAAAHLDKHFESNALLYDASQVPSEGNSSAPSATGETL